MKNLLRVTRSTAGGQTMLYLYYQEGAKSARTIDLADSVMVDVDAAGETIGVELLTPGRRELELLTEIARDRDLSLDGLFSFA